MVEIKYPPGFGFLESIDSVNWGLWILSYLTAVAVVCVVVCIACGGTYLVVKACEKLSD